MECPHPALRATLSQGECCKTRNPLSVKLRNELQASDIPLLASPQGGVAASSRKFCEATEADAAGVVFLFVLNRKTTPSARSVDASRHFLTRAATPPCGDARRGISLA